MQTISQAITKAIGKIVLIASITSVGVINTTQAARSGEQVFNTTCIACHISGAAGAPRLGEKADWQPRIEKGLESLLATSIKGIGAMPPKGMCGNCSDEELLNSIQFMIDNSQN
ncbi:c-type cytochrome [Marinomonas sp. C2222]|uniref:C-type cytochrome n=1 Tax=Marinomonas sargassi TaxID=2984494 RepID=A0ABT2YUE8_9GAMM|nr:c-type cytochrome [Marinomonas sargassi]MCV2403522.1 c-type cytochrome [Marinomonas sargassi]